MPYRWRRLGGRRQQHRGGAAGLGVRGEATVGVAMAAASAVICYSWTSMGWTRSIGSFMESAVLYNNNTPTSRRRAGRRDVGEGMQ